MPDKPLVSVFIDGHEIRVPAGTNIIEAAKSAGISIPHYCYHHDLSVSGNCRMCLVEMGTEMKDRVTGQPILDEKGAPKVGWMPRPQIACATNAAAGQHFRTTSPMVTDARNSVVEFMLTNHPLDCPICDQAGECKLQEYATDHGRGVSRFTEEKNSKPKHTRLGPRVMLDDERCILCSRCIRFCREVAHDDVLGFTDRGSHTTLSCFPGKELANNYSLNTVDICPVGALTSTDFRFKMRVWFLKQTPSICTESSVGVNTTVWSREGVIYRITPRGNPLVNDSWMSDSGRELYKITTAPNRLTTPSANAFDVTLSALHAGKVAIVGSAYSSLEEQFLLKRLATLISAASTDVVSHTGSGDGLLISADRTPNHRGALLSRLILEPATARLTELKNEIADGKVKTIVVVREDLLAAGLTAEELKGITVIQLASHANETTPIAAAVFPVPTVFERSGSFVNQAWRVQKFEAAIPAPEGVSSELALLDRLLQRLGEVALPAPTPEAVWKLMGATLPELKGLAYSSIGSAGAVVDSHSWSSMSFPEGKSLHYTPATPVGV